MPLAREAHDSVFRDLCQLAPWQDVRRLDTLADAVAGLILEQDARLSRQALAFQHPKTMPGRVRRLLRLLDAPFDRQRLYGAVLEPHLHRWQDRTAWMVLDTSSIRGRVYFVRLGLCYRRRTIPVAWLTYAGHSSTVPFATYVGLLRQAHQLLPGDVRRCLIADRGFCHPELFVWCINNGWSFRIRAKRKLLITLPDGQSQLLEDFRSRCGAMRLFHSVFVGRDRLGPLGLLLTWPRYMHGQALHVLSDDAPGMFTVPDILRCPSIDASFRDEKDGGFRIETLRLAAPRRIDRLLLALAQLYIVTAGDDLAALGAQGLVQSSAAAHLSRFQLGCRAIRRAAWRGEPLSLRVHLTPDPPPASIDGALVDARRICHRIGLVPGQVWLPAGSFEIRNAYWWLPGRFPPRLPSDGWL
jgi:hypothetical protein